MNHKKSLGQTLAGFSAPPNALSVSKFLSGFLTRVFGAPSPCKFKPLHIQRCLGLLLLALAILSVPVEALAAATVYLADDSLLSENSPPAGNKLPVLFVHGHDLAPDPDNPNYKKNWQNPLDYPSILNLPSFKIALDLPQNSLLGIEPYYIHFQDQDRSIVKDAEEIGEAIELILQRHGDPTATNVKVVIIAYSKGTISTRLYLKNLSKNWPDFRPVSEFIAIAPPNHGLASSANFIGDSLALMQLNNGYDENCNPFGDDTITILILLRTSTTTTSRTP